MATNQNSSLLNTQNKIQIASKINNNTNNYFIFEKKYPKNGRIR
jgi:hypothetical protein